MLAGTILGGLATVGQAFAIGTLIVDLVHDPAGSGWHDSARWLIGITLLRAGLGFTVDLAAADAATTVSTTLRARILRSALRLDHAEWSRQRTGELTLLATRGVVSVEPYLTRYLPTLAVAGVLPLVTVAAIWWLDWLSGLIVLLTLPLVPVFAILIGLATRDRAERQWRQLGLLSGHFLDVVRGLPTLVVFRRAAAQSRRIREITDRYRRATVETLKIAFASSAVLELIATISVALVAVAVGLRLAAGGLDFRTALVVLLLAPEAYWPLRRVGAEYHAAAEGVAALVRADELIGPPTASRPPGSPWPVGPIEIAGLTLGYPTRPEPVVSELRATIGPGLTAIVGPSGVGKSTLLAALLGELPARSGTISAGGRRIDSDLDGWRRQVAWAPQRPWLTPDTIAENLRVGRPDATAADLAAALAAVGLTEVVAALPAGVDTRLGEDGAGLSAGQRARLALARVVLADRPVVVLDEPSAHLDRATEQILLDTLRRLARDRTVVVVAHRPAVEAAADRVIRLTGSAIPERDSVSPVPTAAPAVPTRSAAEPETARSRFGTRTGLILGTGSVASGVALTATACWLITRAAAQPPVLFLLVAIVSVRLFGLARPVLRYAERIVSHDAALVLLAEQRARIYDALVPLVPGRLGTRRGDLLASVVDDVDALLDEQLRVRQPLWTGLWVGALAVGFTAAVSPPVAPVIAGMVALGGAAALLSRAGTTAAEATAVRCRAAVSDRVEQILHGARDLVLWQADGAALAALTGDSARWSAAVRRSAAFVALGRALPLLGGGFGLVAVAALNPDLGAPMLALVVMLPIALVDALTPMADAGALSVRTAAARARLAALTRQTPLVTDPAHPAAGSPSGAAALEQVTAGWGARPALTGVDLDIPDGARIGVVGQSGSGKTTLAGLLLRFLDPDAGRVTLAGTDLRELTLDRVRSRIGLVDDDPHVFASSVVENVRLARPEATDAEIRTALDTAQLGPWVDGLPYGQDTLIGEGNAAVSGGERARLGLARIVLADPAIVVLDEPTAHLDDDTANRLAADLLGAPRTTVWITHSTVGLDLVDRVLTLRPPPRSE